MPRGPEKEEGMEKLSVSILQMWTYRPQKRQVGSAFALTYILLLRSCKLMGVFIIAPLPPLWMELLLHNSRASSLHGRYPASTLLLAPPPPSRRPLTSRC